MDNASVGHWQQVVKAKETSISFSGKALTAGEHIEGPEQTQLKVTEC